MMFEEIIFTMLKNNSEFMDRIDSLTERKMKSMNQKVMDAKASYNIAQSIKLIRRDCLQNRQNNFFHRRCNSTLIHH